MAGPTAFDASAIISGVISQDRLPPGLTPFVVATGAGTGDTTEALQSAIDSAYGKLLFIPKGEYILSRNASTGYCLRIMDSVSILMEPGAVIKLAASVPNTVNAIQIGDGSTTVSGVSIEGGVIDGDAISNGGSYSIAPALVYVSGPVQRVSIRGATLRNALGSGLVVDGQSSESRAKHITVEDCIITEVAEGVRFQKCDEFHMRGGSITKMMAQDCFEPHGALQGWSLRDCYIAEPHSTNSAVEVYPQYGDIQGGLIENCTIVSDEIRMSLSSGTSSGSYEVRDVTVRGCYLKNSQVFAGVDGKLKNITFDGNVFEGPSHVDRGTSNPQAGIRIKGESNTAIIKNNKISGYQSSGIVLDGDDGLIAGNEIFNNGQNSSISVTQRHGIQLVGSRVRVTDNLIYDNQTVPTQLAGMSYGGNDISLIGNKFWGATPIDNSGKSPLRQIWVGNLGLPEVIKTTVTVDAGATTKTLNHTALGVSSFAFSSIVAQPLSNMSPASCIWFTRTGGNIRMNLDAAPASSTNFLLVFHINPGITAHP